MQTDTVPDVGNFEAMYAENVRPLVALAWALTGDGDAAADIVHDALTDAFRSWSDISQRDRPDLWIRRMVINQSATHRRDRGRAAAKNERLARQIDRRSSELEPRQLHLIELVRTLPTLQRQAVALYYLEDRSIADVAATLEVSPGTVKTSLSRARARLADLLNAESTESDT